MTQANAIRLRELLQRLRVPALGFVTIEFPGKAAAASMYF